MDEILVYSANQEEHDNRTRATLYRSQEAGLTLKEKCVIIAADASLTGLGSVLLQDQYDGKRCPV